MAIAECFQVYFDHMHLFGLFYPNNFHAIDFQDWSKFGRTFPRPLWFKLLFCFASNGNKTDTPIATLRLLNILIILLAVHYQIHLGSQNSIVPNSRGQLISGPNCPKCWGWTLIQLLLLAGYHSLNVKVCNRNTTRYAKNNVQWWPTTGTVTLYKLQEAVLCCANLGYNSWASNGFFDSVSLIRACIAMFLWIPRIVGRTDTGNLYWKLFILIVNLCGDSDFRRN